MSDITSLAKRIILIGKGKKLYDGTLFNLRKNYDYLRKITVTTNDKILLNEEYIIEEKIKDGKIEFTIDIRKIEISKFINYLTNKISIIDIDIDSGNIDNVIIKLYEDFKI